MSATEQSETASAPLDLGASSHEQMDKAVLSVLAPMGLNNVLPEELTLIQQLMILSLIVASSNALLDGSFCNLELLKDRLDLQQAIREAFGARSFEKVRNMTMLWSSKAKALEPHQ
ncbi:hypothetical protein BJ138DRAFT_1184483, partial [Hygrophoropsis aurantiaca]